MLSHTSEYALRAVLYIGMHETEGPVKLERIAEALHVPRNYLSKTLHQLARAGVLKSERGPSGGFQLPRPASEVMLAEVVAPFEPSRLARSCLLGKGECSDATACAAHERWKHVAEPMQAFFGATTVADLLHGTGSLAGLPVSV
jgi:Rrf2 family protein